MSEAELIVRFGKGEQLKKPLIIVTKKVAKKAVDRNRIRRLIVEALRAIDRTKESPTIIVKKNLANLKMDQIKQKLEKLL